MRAVATFVREALPRGGWSGVWWAPVQRIYHVEPSISLGDGRCVSYVMVSAAVVHGEAQTYMFGVDPTGVKLSHRELQGSIRGALDHELALRTAGYSVVKREFAAGLGLAFRGVEG